MMLRRLLEMEPAELMVRGWQAANRQWERVAPQEGVLNAALSDAAVGAEELYERFCAHGGERFFAGAGDEAIAARIAARMPQARARTLATAERIGRRRFPILGYGFLSFGDPTDWHYDPIAGKHAPRRHWSRIDALNAATLGDSKVIWELNRHQWLLDLGQAYRYTGDERYAASCAVFLREWMQVNPRGIGINWNSSLELALRLIAWCWALFLFRGSRVLSPSFFTTLLGWIDAQATHVERYLSYYYSPNTHLTGEALGLFYVGIVFPELAGAARWRTRGARILEEQLDQQLFEDGVHFEQASAYQRYTVEIYLHFLILAARNGIAVAPAVASKLQRALDFLLALRRPDGSLPQIGDADGGSLLPLVRRDPDDLAGVFAVAAAFFQRSDYVWAARAATPEMLWLLGAESEHVFDALPRHAPAEVSVAFGEGGYAIMRSDAGEFAHQLIFDVGPLGCPVSGAHGHADLLSIQCAAFGQAVLVDAGTYCYTADAAWRNYFRSSAAHSTVSIDGLGQATPTEPFKWRQRPRARLRRWISNAAFDYADADHDAYVSLPDPVRHRRRVFFAKPHFWVVVDELHGMEEHDIELRFQFAAMTVNVDNDWVQARGLDGRGLLMRAFAHAPLAASIHAGETTPIGGWLSADYGQRTAAPQLRYATHARLPLRIVSLLLPMEDVLASSPAVVFEHGASADTLVFAAGGGRIVIDDESITRVSAEA